MTNGDVPHDQNPYRECMSIERVNFSQHAPAYSDRWESDFLTVTHVWNDHLPSLKRLAAADVAPAISVYS